MRLSLFLLAATLWCTPVLSETPPVPPRKDQALNKYSNRLTEEQNAKGVLKQKIQTIQEELSLTKQNLIDIASDIQTNESNLKNLQKRIENLETKKNGISEKIQNDEESMSKLISTLIRLRRTPPEALFAKKQEPYKTAQTISIMRNILPSIESHAEKLDAALHDLDKVSQNLKKQRTQLMNESDELQERHIKLSELLSKRKNLHSKINHDIKMREITIQKISLKAKNLEELVARIKKEEKELEKKRLLQQKTAKRRTRSPAVPSFSDAKLPISGIIRTAYNTTDDYGAKSKGLTIEGRTESLVIAPMDGRISYTGTFKRYGNLVIIEHDGGYHSLIAGLGTISAIVGTNIKSGEPIGLLPNSSLNPRPTVYYELRRNGKPINPAKKFAQLG